MKKYVTLRCSVCARTKDSLIDLTHYAPDRCTITLGCEGRLSPSGYTSDGTVLLGVPPSGLQNWYPRGTTISTNAIKEDVLYDTSTGSKQQVILAVANSSLPAAPSDTSTVTLNLIAEQQTAKEYRQYVYRKSGSFTVVNGVESGVAKKVLRYSIVGANPDQVEVYVDGVKRNRGTGSAEYQLYDGSVGSPVPPNSVLFNTAVTGVAPQVDVIVTKAATQTTAQIVFNRLLNDESRAGTGAWEGVDAVRWARVPGDWSLFYCDFSELAPMSVDLKLMVDTVTGSTFTDGPTVSLDLSKAALLLSRTEVHTQLDRQRSKFVLLSSLNSNTQYLIVKLWNKARKLYVTEASTTDVFPMLEVKRYGAATLQKTSLTGNTDSAELDNSIIIGPDA